MNNIKIFENKELGTIRTVTIEDEPWFVGKDVASALGYEKERNAIQKHVDAEDALKWGIPTNGGVQDMTVINESGLYALIFGSKLESAKRFKHWITSEVLPSIRKTGSYSMVEYPVDAATLKGLASSGNLLRSAMKDEGAKPYDVAVVIDALFKQSGVSLPECFIKKPDFEQLSLWDSTEDRNE